MTSRKREGWRGWDDYAPFYDWENARTLGRRDLPFWRGVTAREQVPTLELGCGTGRLLVPLARGGVTITGIDRSEPMLARARQRIRHMPRDARPSICRGDIRALPFASAAFGLVMAPYGMVQSLLDDDDLDAMLAEAARVLEPGGIIGLDLVPDLVHWEQYERRVSLKGTSAEGLPITLVETVEQDRRRGLTTFHEEFVEGTGRRRQSRRFSLTFRTVQVPALIERLAAHGLAAESLLGDYRGRPWHADADVWIVLARRTRTRRATRPSRPPRTRA